MKETIGMRAEKTILEQLLQLHADKFRGPQTDLHRRIPCPLKGFSNKFYLIRTSAALSTVNGKKKSGHPLQAYLRQRVAVKRSGKGLLLNHEALSCRSLV